MRNEYCPNQTMVNGSPSLVTAELSDWTIDIGENDVIVSLNVLKRNGVKVALG